MGRMIEVSDETFEKIKNQLQEEEKIELSTYDDFVGKKWYIRTVTYHQVGECVKRIGMFLQLKDASWVADSGRFSNALKTGILDEVEPVGDCLVNLNAIADIFLWKHALPKEQK